MEELGEGLARQAWEWCKRRPATAGALECAAARAGQPSSMHDATCGKLPALLLAAAAG